MDTKQTVDPKSGRAIVYVRAVKADDLPPALRAQIGDAGLVYTVNSAEGEPLAMVADRRSAFLLAQDNDLAPVSVH